MKILITGGAGFIGSNFVHHWKKSYPESSIIVLDKLTYAGNPDNLSELIDTPNYKFIQADIVDKNVIDNLFSEEKFDFVVNFAAETHVDRSITNPGIFVQTNIIGTHNLLEASRNNNVKRYHQVSTDEVYGDLGADSKDFFTEQTPIKPNCPYAATKACADLLVLSYFETYRFPATISRCSNNYGPYQFPEKLIPYFFRLISENKSVPVYGNGQNVRDWLFVLDHCKAIDLILHKGRHGEVYNIGGNNEKTNLQITKILLDFLGKDESLIQYVDDRLAHDMRYAIDSSKLQTELGWSPDVTFEEGIKLTFEWYNSHSDWVNKLISNLEERKHKIVSKSPLPPSRK